LKLLLRFFLNQNLSGYLQGLSKELDENTNSIRVELNRLEQAGILSSGRRKLYRVNKSHPLTSDLTSIIRKVSGIEDIVERVVNRIGEDLHQVWISGQLAMGLESDEIEVLLVGRGFDDAYISELMDKVEKKLEKKVSYSTTPALSTWQEENSLLVWQNADEK
jgi:VIT1/CCC1 family predicted Fe2+/Mn2+ transporter